MDDKAIYQKLYRALGDVTPLGFDCGRLCGAACCRVEPDLPGMYLFPGEEALFAGRKGFTVTQACLPGYGPVPLLSCVGRCLRQERPLSCRVFPLAPRVRLDEVSVRMDPRGKAVCPLCRGPLSALSKEFAEAAQNVFQELLAHGETAAFLRALSSWLDEHSLPPR